MLIDSERSTIFQLKLMSGTRSLVLQSLFHSKRININFMENEVQFFFGSSVASPKLRLLYTEIISWVVVKNSGCSDINFVYKMKDETVERTIVLRAKYKQLLTEFLDCLQGHIAELMVFKGVAKTVVEALGMFQKVTMDEAAMSRYKETKHDSRKIKYESRMVKEARMSGQPHPFTEDGIYAHGPSDIDPLFVRSA